MRAKCRYATLDQPFFVACTYRKICERQWGEGMTHANACDTGPELTSSHSEVLSRAAICAVLLAMFTITLGYGIALPILPLLIERDVAGVTAAALSRHTGFLTGAYIMAIFLFAPLWGRASDRWGRRPVMIIGLGGFALASIWMALASSISLLYSARFMGEDTPYPERFKAIFEKLNGVPEEKRTARFVSCIAAAFPDGRRLVSYDTVEGIIGYEAKGENGFGYDPIFYVPEKGKYMAELSSEEKNAISHRGKALRKMKEMLKKEL